MSCTRVFVFEQPKGFAYTMKCFRSGTKPMLDKLKRKDPEKLFRSPDRREFWVDGFLNSSIKRK